MSGIRSSVRSPSIGDMTLLTVTEVSRKQEFLHIRRRAIGGKEEIRFSQVRPPVDLVNQRFEMDGKVSAVVPAAGAGCRPRLSKDGV